MISENPDWIFAGVFSDVGKSGLRREGRIGLDKMLKKASKDEIDYILVKSISRLSRDIVDVLEIIRCLRERGINMHFETEKLDSIKLENELEITLEQWVFWLRKDKVCYRIRVGYITQIFRESKIQKEI